MATSTPSATETAGATAPAEAGMRVYLDPESGMVIGLPPVQDPAAIEPQAAAPILQEEVLPDGSVMVDLKGTGQEYYLIQLDADGKPVASCVQDPAKALAAPVAAPGVK